MTDEAKELLREYRRAWQRANKDKCKMYRERYWEKKAAQAAAAKDTKSEVLHSA